jgi:prevent-host-death family protein
MWSGIVDRDWSRRRTGGGPAVEPTALRTSNRATGARNAFRAYAVTSIDMNTNRWTVSEARRRFSEVLRRSRSEPQLIYRRGRLIAAVVATGKTKAAGITSKVTIGDRFEEARALFREENYRLPQLRRRSRSNDFVHALDPFS